MAGSAEPTGAAGPGQPAGAARPPRVLPWLLAYSVGRLAIAAALVLLLWTLGLGSFPGLLFGLLLSMPVAYLLLRPARERLTEALAARTAAREARRADVRARMAGDEPA